MIRIHKKVYQLFVVILSLLLVVVIIVLPNMSSFVCDVSLVLRRVFMERRCSCIEYFKLFGVSYYRNEFWPQCLLVFLLSFSLKGVAGVIVHSFSYRDSKYVTTLYCFNIECVMP